MVPSTHRALKHEFGDADILNAKRFNTQLFDFFEGYRPVQPTPYSGKATLQMGTTLLNLVLPCVGVFKSLGAVPGHCVLKLFFPLMAQALWFTWLLLQFIEIGVEDAGSMSWVAFSFLIGIIGYTRMAVREHYNVYGSIMDDLWCSLMMFPFVLTQTQLMCANDGLFLFLLFTN